MIRKIFENLIGLDHPNIVKFHKYWTEMAEANMEKPRVVSLVHWMIGWMVEGMDGWMDGWREIDMEKPRVVSLVGWIEGWMDGWMDG